jgi:class 3 adenylate cyclase
VFGSSSSSSAQGERKTRRASQIRLVATLALATALSLAAELGLRDVLERKWELPLAFAVRAAIGRAPPWHPRLKIVTLDDAAAAVLGDVELNATGWATLLESMAQAHVESITIDDLFGQPPLGSQAEQERFTRALGLGVPVATTAVVSGRAVPWRRPLDKSSALLAIDRYTLPGEDALAAFARIRVRQATAYGPFGAMAGRVAALGHLEYDGMGSIEAFQRLGQRQTLPHLGLALSRPAVGMRGMRVAGNDVPDSTDGRLLIDFPDLQALDRRAQSLAPLLRAARDKQRLPGIYAGDRVLVLTRWYTGGEARMATPLGLVPSGTVLAAVMNASLTGRWLTQLDGGWIAIVIASLTGLFIGRMRRIDEARVALAGTLVALPVFALGAFAWRGYSVSWMLPWTAVGLIGLVTTTVRRRALDARRAELRAGLDGLIPPQRLDVVLRAVEHTRHAPSERVLTLMFVEVVGFSSFAQTVSPATAFAMMESIVARIARRVHSFDGVIDRTLDEGLLCYFGHPFDASGGVFHAEQALRCAAAMQRENLECMISDAHAGRSVFPLRIGINTSNIFVGDPSDARRVAVSLIGHGVAMARRLENACEYNKIMLGPATFALLPDSLRLDGGARRKLVRDDTDRGEAVDAYEFDPFAAIPERLAAAAGAYRTVARKARVDERLPLSGDMLRAKTPYGPAQVVDVSRRGLAIVLSPYLAAGLELHVTLEPIDDQLGAALATAGLPSLVGEIRWSRPVAGGYLHGLLVKNLGDAQREALYACLASAARRMAAPVERRRIG